LRRKFIVNDVIETDPDRREKICIVGGGIAGLACAWSLLGRGFANLEIFERSSQLCSQASAKNAAIYRPLEADPVLTELAVRNQVLLGELARRGEVPLLRKTGLLFLDERHGPLRSHLEVARRFHVAAEWIESPKERFPHQLGALPSWYRGLFCADGGVLAIHEIAEVLRRELLRCGVTITLNEEVKLDCEKSAPRRIRGIWKSSGAFVKASRVVLAAGAGVGGCLRAVGLSAPLLPLKRHLAWIDAGDVALGEAPVIWQFHPEIYFRAESGGVLVSPCDESPCASGVAQRDVLALAPLHPRLEHINEGLAQGSLRQFWACTRTKSLDGRPFIGPDHRLPGLFWLSALGGFGMSTALAAGELLSELALTGACREEFCPQRFELSGARRKSAAKDGSQPQARFPASEAALFPS
jgi:D-arginine dehydrogenase